MQLLSYLKNYLSLPKLNSIGFNIVFLILAMGLLIFVPSLRLNLLVFMVLLIAVEAYQNKIQTINTPFFKGLIMFTVATITAIIIFSQFHISVKTDFYVSVTVLALYYLVAASVEEDIFRAIIPNMTGSKVFSNALYTVFHFGVIATASGMQTPNFSDMFTPVFIGLVIFTFIFGFAMQLLTDFTKSTVPAKAMHWVYNMFTVGILFNFIGR